MPRMLKREETLGKFSVFNLINTIFPFSNSETVSNVGANDRHGPHQGAQKSTTTGKSDFSIIFKSPFSSTSETNLWKSKLDWHFPQTALELIIFSVNTLLIAPHFGHEVNV